MASGESQIKQDPLSDGHAAGVAVRDAGQCTGRRGRLRLHRCIASLMTCMRYSAPASRQKQGQACGSKAPRPFVPVSSLHIAIVKGIAALRAELGRMGGIVRLPAALVALVLGHAGGLFRPALSAEFPLVHRAAGAGPAVRGRLGLAALGAEFSGGGGPAGTPALSAAGLRLFCRSWAECR